MKWTVTWTPEAEEELTNMWLRAANRDRLSRPLDIIETELKHDADKKGDTQERPSRIALLAASRRIRSHSR
jgi:hypothetical protein